MPAQVIIVDSSKAFEGVDDPAIITHLAAAPEKRAPYRENINHLLTSLHEVG